MNTLSADVRPAKIAPPANAIGRGTTQFNDWCRSITVNEAIDGATLCAGEC